MNNWYFFGANSADDIFLLSLINAFNPRLKFRRTGKQLPQHIRQNSTMTVIINFDRRVDPQSDRYLFTRPIGTMNDERNILSRFDARLNSEQIKRLATVELQ